jgi:two-component system sensor histidine kinase DesK
MYNRRQLLYLKEKQLKESEHQNQLLQKELEKQKSIEAERERISHDMHDDLGAGISALKLQAEFLKQRAENDDLKNDIDELLKTSEEMNLSMREMLWSLNSGNDTLGSFIDYSKMYAQNF